MAKPTEIVGNDWQETVIDRMTFGLNLADQPALIDQKYFTRFRNMISYRGKAQRDTGFSAFLGAVRGKPRKQFQHVTRAGVGHLLLITNETLYRKVGSQWQFVGNGVESTVATADFEQNDDTLEIDDATGFSVNDYISIALDDGTEYQGQITNISTNTLTVDPPNPWTASGLIGNAVRVAVGLSGDDDNHVVALTIPWSDECVFTNGVDAPQVYDPATVTVGNVSGLPASGNTQCKSIAIYDNSLILLNTSEGGQDFPQRMRWSDRANISAYASGEAGYIDFLAEPHHIKHALALGPYLFVYRTGSIYRTNAVNSATKRFTHDRMIANDGIFSTGGVVDLGDRHIYCGKDDFYEYRGGYDKVPVGEAIREGFFGNSSPLDKTKVHKLFMVNLEERQEVLVFFQGLNTSNPRECFRYNDLYKSWGTRDFSEDITGYGTAVSAGDTVTWANAVGSWANYAGSWNSSSIVGSNTSVFLLSGSFNQSYEYDFTSGLDVDTPIQGTLDTKDFEIPGWITRLDFIDIKCSGLDIYTYYSTDEGNTWTLIQIRDPYNDDVLSDFISPGAQAKKIRISKTIAFEKIRFRFESFNTFSIEWMKLRMIPDYEW